MERVPLGNERTASGRQDPQLAGKGIGFDVVVGIDGTPASRAALEWAARHARATGSRLVAVRVLEWPVGFNPGTPMPTEPTLRVADSDVGTSYRHGMQGILDEVHPRPGWRLQFAEGPVAPMLVRLAEDADLLVIGSPERTTAADVISGAIARYCTSTCRSPVVVVAEEYLERVSSTPEPTFRPPEGQ